MIFIGEPNLYVKITNKIVIRRTGKKGFYFDKNGKYETDNELLIKVLKQHFKYENKKHCKKCDFTCDNQGELLSHYRTEHPKEG